MDKRGEGLQSMYKVLAVDENVQTVKILKDVIRWADYGCRFCGMADLERAVAAAESGLDLLIVDCDRGGDIVGAVNQMRRFNPELEVLFISYRNRFQAVQEAILLNASMILAPFRVCELESELQSVAQRLRRRLPEAMASLSGGFLVRRALRYIGENYDRGITLGDAAAGIGVSTWHLSRSLRAQTGHSFTQLVNAVRIRQAKDMLAETDMKIYEVAQRTGFTETAHFQNLFKRIAGCTPTQYRRQVGKKK